MEALMAPTPLREVRRALRLAAGRGEGPMMALVPVHRRRVHVVPRELVDDEQRRERNELVESGLERMDVVQDTSRDDGVEGPWIVELLERHAPVDRAVGRGRVDREHVVAGACQRGCDTAFASA